MTASVDEARPVTLFQLSRSARIPGPRAAGPLVRLNCASSTAEPVVGWVEGLQPRHWLIEAELNGCRDDGDGTVEAALVEETVPASEATRPTPIRGTVSPLPLYETPGLRKRQSPRWLLIGLVASLVAIVLGGAIVWTAAGHRDHSATPPAGRTSVAPVVPAPAPSTVQRAAAVAWLVDALDRHSDLVTDSLTRAALLAQGLSADTVFAAGQPLPSTTNFLVSTRQLRDGAAAGQYPPVARLLAESQPVAQFGTGADSVQVREVIPAGTNPDVMAASRRMAGQALLSNKALSVVPAAATVLSEGRLDLRPETLIAALATQTSVRLIGSTQQQVEASVGAPVRTVQLSLDSPALLNEYIDALPSGYRPATSRRQADGSYVIQWYPDLATAPPVS